MTRGDDLVNTFLLVDGYNIINAWGDLRELSLKNFDNARTKLIEKLANYQGFKKITVILVFDAYLVKGSSGNIVKQNGLSVVYTKEAETADNYIEKITKNMPKRYRVIVATSDALEQLIVMGYGAERMTPKELKEEIASTEKSISKKISSIKPVKNNLLMDNLNPEMQDFLENLRRQKGNTKN